MKSNIEILRKRISISDKEVESTMDFEGVLDRYRAENLNNSITTGLTNRFLIFIGFISVVIIGYGLINYLRIDEDKQVSEVLNTENESIEEKMDTSNEDKVSPGEEVAVQKGDLLPSETNDNGQSNLDEKVIAKALSKKSDVPVLKKPHENSTPREGEHPLAEESDQNPVYEYIDAKPVDGLASLYGYFEANLSYPEEALQDSIEGAVVVRFTISKEGEVKNIILEKSLGEPFDKEARRLIGAMPPWQPASINGDPVDSQVKIPVHFEIDTDQD